MKKKLLVFIFQLTLLQFYSSFGQSGEWTWLSGDSIGGSGAVYGIQGVPSVNNHPPGGYEYIEWKDKQGNFWVHSGWIFYADLWKYNPATNEWTWVKGNGLMNQAPVYGTQGVPSITNSPGSRVSGIPTWVDTTGNLWLFGGSYANMYKNDLWKYDIATNEWTWMKGDSTGSPYGVHGTMGVPSPLNVPGGRQETSSAWTDISNNLWLFGGAGLGDIGGGGYLNDLMKYDISTNEWTWMNGSASENDTGNYGMKGVSSPANKPSARWTYSKWHDRLGNLWILGGSNNLGTLNDLWKFDVGINEWTWISGPKTFMDFGMYQGYCAFDTINIPRARFENRSAVTDNCGRFWLFGGFMNNNVPNMGFLNDLWVFDPTTLQWNWVSGTNVNAQMGSYGTKGVSSPANIIPSRGGADAWWGNDNRLYIFGGTRYPWPSYMFDLWVFTPDSNCLGYCTPQTPVVMFNRRHHICPGTCTDFTNLTLQATSYIWYFPGATPDTSTDINPQSICYNTPGTYSVTLIATNAAGSNTLTLNNYITVYPQPSPQGIIQSGDTLFANQGATTYQWYFNGNIISGATDYFYVATQSGDYNVVATDANGCEVEAVINNVIAGLTPAIYKDEGVVLFPNPVHDEFTIQNAQFTMGAAIQISIYDMLGELVVPPQTLIFKPETSIDVSDLAKGMYWLEINSGGKMYRNKFVKQ